MKKRLIALMLSATLMTGGLTGCAENKKNREEILNNRNQIRKMLEYDANTNISKNRVEAYSFKLEYEINDEKFYLTFITSKNVGDWATVLEDDVKIKYEVDKDTYYDFKNNHISSETQQDVERVKSLTETYDPIEVINPEGNVIQQ